MLHHQHNKWNNSGTENILEKDYLGYCTQAWSFLLNIF